MLAVFLAQEFPSRSQGPPCARPLRQHIGGLLHKSPGGFTSILQTGMPNSPVVPRGSCCLFEQLTSRGPQCTSRHPVETGAEARGMEAPPQGGGADMEGARPGPSGPVCVSRDVSLSTLVSPHVMHPAPLGLDAMVQMWPRLRLYAFPPIALLPGVLERVRRDRVLLLLIAPQWPGRVWFPDIISLLYGPPLVLPASGGTFCPKQGARYFTPNQNCGNCGLGLWGGPADRLRCLNRGCWDHSPLQSSLHEETLCLEVESFHFMVQWPSAGPS